jgi:site-specific DNA-cytosine methylase
MQDGITDPITKCDMRVLVACEFSATVRDAFRARGFDAWSCDLLPTEGDPRWHIQGDALEVAYSGNWDLMISHPPCTHLAVSGARWFKDKLVEQAEALAFVRALLDAPIRHIALENPVSVISSRIRKPDQTIQPWQFGHGETKATCLWLKNLPKLKPTDIVEGREARVHRMPPGPDGWKERSRTFAGIAAAMADQWGAYLELNSPARLVSSPARPLAGVLNSAPATQLFDDRQDNRSDGFRSVQPSFHDTQNTRRGQQDNV